MNCFEVAAHGTRHAGASAAIKRILSQRYVAEKCDSRRAAARTSMTAVACPEPGEFESQTRFLQAFQVAEF